MHMWRSLFLGESATLPCEGGEPQRSPVLGFLLYLGVHPLTQNDHVRQGNTCGEGRDYRGQTRFQSQGAEPQRSPSFGFPSIYVYTVRRKTAEFCVITHTHIGGGTSFFLHLRPSSQKGIVSQRNLQFGSSSVLMRRPTRFDLQRQS